MPIRFVNNFQSQLATAGGITALATELDLAAGHGARLLAQIPDLGVNGVYTKLTIRDVAGNLETVKVIAIAIDKLTIARAQEAGEPARAWSFGDIIDSALAKSALEDLQAEALAAAGAAGAAAQEYADAAAGAAVSAAQEYAQAAVEFVEAVAASPEELSELHGQGAVAADFAKLHEITASAADLDQLKSKTAVNTTDDQSIAGTKNFTDDLQVGGAVVRPTGKIIGQALPAYRPVLSTSSFTISDLPQISWHAISATGGIGYEWSALNEVPLDAEWVLIKILLTANVTHTIMSVRVNGYTGTPPSGTDDQLVAYHIGQGQLCHAFVPLNQRSFYLNWTTNQGTPVHKMYLVGYGYNS